MATDEAKSLENTVKELKKVNDNLATLVTNTPKPDTGASATELAREQKTRDQKQTSLFEQMAASLKSLHKSFLDSVKEKGKMGLGIIIAAIAAPIIALVAFFKQLAVEFRFLKALTGKGLTKLFAPLKTLFTGEGPLGKIFTSLSNTIKGITKSIKGSKVFIAIGEIATKLKSTVTSLGKFFAPVGRFFRTIFNLSKDLIALTAKATGIVKFAAGFGQILGKIFLPITLIISAFDFITGFMDGYKEGGILGGLKGGLTKLFKGLIGMPLDLLKSAVSWILGKFGFKNAEKTLDAFSFSQLIEDMIGGIFDMIDGAVTWVKLLFSDPVAALKVLWTKLLGTFKSVSDILMWPIDKAINWVMDLFGWGDPKKEFSITKFFFGKPDGVVTKAIDWISDLFKWGDDEKDKDDKGFSISALVDGAMGKIKEYFWAKDGKSGILQFDIASFLPSFDLKGAFSGMGDMFNIGSILGSIGQKLEAQEWPWGTDWARDILLNVFDPSGGPTVKKTEATFGTKVEGMPQQKQAGGSIKGGQPYLVGEQGPELILPSGSGQVIPHMRTQQMIQASIQKSIDAVTSGGGGGGVSNSGNTSVVDSHTETTMVNTGVAVRRPIILGKT